MITFTMRRRLFMTIMPACRTIWIGQFDESMAEVLLEDHKTSPKTEHAWGIATGTAIGDPANSDPASRKEETYIGNLPG